MVDIGGLTVLQRSVAAFAGREDVVSVIIITAANRFAAYRGHLAEKRLEGKGSFVAGGRERWESVLFGVREAAKGRARYVAVHDAARPLVSSLLIDEAFAMTRERGAALPCVPEPATLKRRSADGRVQETVDRRNLYQARRRRSVLSWRSCWRGMSIW